MSVCVCVCVGLSEGVNVYVRGFIIGAGRHYQHNIIILLLLTYLPISILQVDRHRRIH